jgi:hypothetical protein
MVSGAPRMWGKLTGRPVRAHVVLEGVEVRNAFQGSYEPLVIRAEFEEENGARKSSSDSKLRPRPGERPRPWKQGAPGGELRKAKSGSKINYFLKIPRRLLRLLRS